MRNVRMVEDSKRVAVEAVKLTFGKVGHINIIGHLAKTATVAGGCKWLKMNWWSRGGSNSWPPHCEWTNKLTADFDMQLPAVT